MIQDSTRRRIVDGHLLNKNTSINKDLQTDKPGTGTGAGASRALSAASKTEAFSSSSSRAGDRSFDLRLVVNSSDCDDAFWDGAFDGDEYGLEGEDR